MHGHRVQRENGESPKPERRVQPSENGREVTMKHRKGIIVLLLCAILALGMCVAMSHVSKAEDESTDESKEEFIFDMANADRRFVIDSSTGEGKQLVITGSSSSYGLHIRANKGENITIIFRDLSIDMTNVGIDMDKSAIFVVGEGDVTIKLEGKNSIIAGPGRPGINKVKGGEGYNSASIEGWLTITADDDSNELVVKGGSNGAAIGGYFENTGSKIRIAGGTVTAIGGDGAAGIGGGHKPSYRKASNGENIVITGGIVTAIGSDGSAGIGGGYLGQGSNITITGGIVTAIGGDGAAGIGSGAMGNCENITIAGGTVYAVGGNGGAGIGGGQYNRQQDSADELGKVSGIIITGTADVHAAGGIREFSQSMVAKAAAIGYGIQEVSSDACSDGDEIEICTTGEVDGKTLKLTGNVSKYEYGATDKQILSGEAEKIEYVLEFDSNGGEGSMESKHGTTGLPIPLPENAFVRKGYVFLGWSYSSEPDSEIISTDEIVILKNSVTVTLYAVWKCVLVKTEAVEPTCTADGCKEYWSCDTCEEKFLDAAGKTVATEEDIVIPAKGHKWKPATEEAPKTCEVCGATEGEPLPVKPVFVKIEAVEATCTVDGHAEYWVCDDREEKFLDEAGQTVATEKDIVIPAKGHKWKPATADAPKTCEVCGATEGEPIRYIFLGDATVKWKSGDLVLTFKSNQEEDASFDKFRKALIDGVAIEAEVKRGSTIVTVPETTLKELPEGRHTLTAVFSDGTCEVKMDIEKTSEPSYMVSPKTGDGLPVTMLLAIALVTVAGMYGCTLWRRKASE